MDKRGKITLLVFIISIVLVGFFSLYFVLALEDNTKEYDSTNKIITIKDPSGNVISDITLNTPLVFKVIRGKDRKVAEFTINNKLSSQEISSVLEKLEFYDIKNNMQKFDRQFTYKYKNSLGFKTVNDYETVCVEGENLGNGTILQDCNQILTGTHQEEPFEWIDLTSLGRIPSGKTTIGIFTDVLPNERIEWVPTLLGVEVDEWAEWTESLNVDIIAYYKLDGTSGAVIDSTNNLNGTAVGGVARGGDGIINKSFNFDGTNDLVRIITTTNDNTYTINFWVNSTNTALNKDFFDGNVEIATYNNGNLIFYVAEIREFGSSSQLLDGDWHMMTAVANSTSLSLYIDGASVLNDTVTATNLDNDNTIASADTEGGSFFNGSIDEFGIWNRSLSASEVTQLYSNGNGITYTNVFSDWNITFNLTDSVTGEQIDTSSQQVDFDISCDNGFNVTDVENDPYLATNFGRGVVECTFSGLDTGNIQYFNENQTITADMNKTVQVPMSKVGGLTQEEHDWLEAVYDCMINGNGCASWTLN